MCRNCFRMAYVVSGRPPRGGRAAGSREQGRSPVAGGPCGGQILDRWAVGAQLGRPRGYRRDDPVSALLCRASATRPIGQLVDGHLHFLSGVIAFSPVPWTGAGRLASRYQWWADRSVEMRRLLSVGQFVVDGRELRNSRLRILPLGLRGRAWTNLTTRRFL